MSNRRKIKRNLQVLYGRFAAEVAAHGPGGYEGTVQHDRGYPGLKRQSLLACKCKPEILISKLES